MFFCASLVKYYCKTYALKIYNFISYGYVTLVQPDKMAAIHDAYHECVEVLSEVDCLREGITDFRELS